MVRAGLLAAAMLAFAAGVTSGPLPTAPPPLPQRLADTGLYEAGTTRVRGDALEYSPRYPLWSDGASKRRWIVLPAGSAIDASRPDAWEFPVGTRLWKEFGYARPVETRYLERLRDGSWRYATYVWNAAGTEATLAPQDGVDLSVEAAPGRTYPVPSRLDCVACHEGPAVPVLGFSAVQLADTLQALAARGLVRGLPAAMLATPPRIEAPTAGARAALGYLHGNCGHCHNEGALEGVELLLAQEAARPRESYARTLASLVGRASRFREHGAGSVRRVVPGDAGASVLVSRMRSTAAATRMPPLGVRLVDSEGLALVERWIAHELPQPPEKSP